MPNKNVQNQSNAAAAAPSANGIINEEELDKSKLLEEQKGQDASLGPQDLNQSSWTYDSNKSYQIPDELRESKRHL